MLGTVFFAAYNLAGRIDDQLKVLGTLMQSPHGISCFEKSLEHVGFGVIELLIISRNQILSLTGL